VGAYNWIVVDATCPACARDVSLRCQTHVASSFDGDARGRFCHRDYRLGEPMAWWPPDSERYSDWRVNGRTDGDMSDTEDEEACYASCPLCAAKLFVALDFRGPRAERIVVLGLESDWPERYVR
jgi:hypothetical protein